MPAASGLRFCHACSGNESAAILRQLWLFAPSIAPASTAPVPTANAAVVTAAWERRTTCSVALIAFLLLAAGVHILSVSKRRFFERFAVAGHARIAGLGEDFHELRSCEFGFGVGISRIVRDILDLVGIFREIVELLAGAFAKGVVVVPFPLFIVAMRDRAAPWWDWRPCPGKRRECCW